MWPCPNCEEQLEEPFETCWKCGTRRSGERDPGFAVTEPVRPEDQAVEHEAAPESTEPKLPTVTYFTIPVYLAVCIGRIITAIVSPQSEFIDPLSVSPLDIVLFVVFLVLIGIPLLVTVLRWFRETLTNGRPWYDFSDFLQFLATFRLPEALRQGRPWFARFYVGCFIATGLLIPVLAIITGLRFITA